MVLQFAGYEGKDEGQQGQQDVIREDAADKDHRAFVTLKNDLYILGRGVLHRVWWEDNEPHCTCNCLNKGTIMSATFQGDDLMFETFKNTNVLVSFIFSPVLMLPQQLLPSDGRR